MTAPRWHLSEPASADSKPCGASIPVSHGVTALPPNLREAVETAKRGIEAGHGFGVNDQHEQRVQQDQREGFAAIALIEQWLMEYEREQVRLRGVLLNISGYGRSPLPHGGTVISSQAADEAKRALDFPKEKP